MRADHLASRVAMAAALAAVMPGAAPLAAPAGTVAQVGGAASIDLYRSEQLRLDELLAARGEELQTIARTAFSDPEVARAARARVFDWLRGAGEFAYVDVSPIQYFGADGPVVHVTVDLVDERDRGRRLAFAPAPTGQIADPDGLVQAWQRLESTTWRLLEAGEIDPARQPPCPVLHCLFGQDHPELADRYSELAQRVPASAARVAEVLRRDADPGDRAAAAFLLGLASEPAQVVDLLLPAIRDPDETVRNNAMRVLGVIALEHREATIPLEPILEAIDFPATTDRNKALAILAGLSERPELAPTIRARAGGRLLALLRLQQPNNRDWALRVLQNVSGEDWSAEAIEAWEAWVRSPGSGGR